MNERTRDKGLQHFVNELRDWLGLEPLYLETAADGMQCPAGIHTTRESLRKWCNCDAGRVEMGRE